MTRKQKDQVIKQNKQNLEQKEQVIINSAKIMKQAGILAEQIQQATGLTPPINLLANRNKKIQTKKNVWIFY